MVKVKVPATTANIGSGFDALGMALNLYNEIQIEEIESGVEVIINGEKYPISIEENLIYKSLIKVLDRYHYGYKGFRINIDKCHIPMCRGLGSSASCIVGGVVAGNEMIGRKLSIEEIINISTEIEGHPDNVVPAILGGMVVSIKEEKKVMYSKVNVPQNLKFVTMIPEFKVKTEDARKVLPDTYFNKDCMFNISRVAMLINALNNGEIDKLRVCVEDKIHQPYRKKLIQDMENIFEKSKELGSKGEFISGSGSTLISIIEKEDEGFIHKMKAYLKGLKDEWNIYLLEPDLEGVKIM